MTNTADLQALLEKIQGGTVAVDLLKIGQAHHAQHANTGSKSKYANNSSHHGKFRVALDMEDCLDRFYGGYYSDWACGGQWNRAYQFVQLLANAFTAAHIEVTAFFDGTLKENRKYNLERNEHRQRILSVLKHIRMIGTPPPKIWWLAPSGLRTSLRNALRSLNIIVVQTVYDHTMEVIDYFHDYKLDAIIGLNPDYIVANSSRYFSSHDLRLSYKGALETKEFIVSKLLSNLSLTADHLPFVAVFLGGYILIDEPMLKKIYEKVDIEYTSDFESRIRKIAETVRNSPTNEIDEFIKHLGLEDWSKQIKDSVEYYQRRTRFSSKKYLASKRKNITTIHKLADDDEDPVSVPLASETNENDAIAKKMLDEVNNLVNDGEAETVKETNEAGTSNKQDTVNNNSAKNCNNDVKKPVAAFIYALPGEVLKTSLNRHQRGIMDSRIYQLLTKKEIYLPQILEDEQYRDIPSIHLFYRPARQAIYAILFNLYHQKYLCSKTINQQSKDQANNQHHPHHHHRSNQTLPEVQISEWISSPQNEYKKAEMVNAVQLPWAVPTIQRLWFGMAFEDKQRRMKAFLTVMRSDTPLMMNRSYVPQHMLVMACVLRYIITSPERNILNRQELDAFLATAFSPHMLNVDYTQELVLPGVYLRGVYLATLFMQGVETASLANDACGVPLPWMMTNPWLFFDGKLFHLKLKMSTYVPTLRELCDDQIDLLLKIERFRKAILEDVEHFLLPAHMDPLYRAGIIQSSGLAQTYGKNQIHSISNIPTMANGSAAAYYNAAAIAQHPQTQQSFYNNITSINSNANNRSSNYRVRFNTQTQSHPSTSVNVQHLPRHTFNRQGGGSGGYQLKVGGVVVGSWAGGAPNRDAGSHSNHSRSHRIGTGAQYYNRYPVINSRGRNSLNTRQQRNATHNQHVSSLARTISRSTYGVKGNRNRRTRKYNRDNKAKRDEKAESAAKNENSAESEENGEGEALVQNGPAKLAKSMCHDILKEDDEIPSTASDVPSAAIVVADDVNGNVATTENTAKATTDGTADAVNDTTTASSKTNGNANTEAANKASNGTKKKGKKGPNASNSIDDKKNSDNETNSAAAANADTAVGVEG